LKPLTDFDFWPGVGMFEKEVKLSFFFFCVKVRKLDWCESIFMVLLYAQFGAGGN